MPEAGLRLALDRSCGSHWPDRRRASAFEFEQIRFPFVRAHRGLKLSATRAQRLSAEHAWSPALGRPRITKLAARTFHLDWAYCLGTRTEARSDRR